MRLGLLRGPVRKNSQVVEGLTGRLPPIRSLRPFVSSLLHVFERNGNPNIDLGTLESLFLRVVHGNVSTASHWSPSSFTLLALAAALVVSLLWAC